MSDGDSPHLGEDEDERKIFVRALSEYSRNCEAPELTPSCPYYEMTRSGPACAEQCQDILMHYPMEHAPPSTYDLGGGIAARPSPRPRRGPSTHDRVFDAREIFLRESSEPLAQWQLTTLIQAIRDTILGQVVKGVSEVSLPSSSELTRELESRGIDVDPLVRVGMNGSIGGAVFVLCVMHDDSPRAEAWRSLLLELTTHLSLVPRV